MPREKRGGVVSVDELIGSADIEGVIDQALAALQLSKVDIAEQVDLTQSNAAVIDAAAKAKLAEQKQIMSQAKQARAGGGALSLIPSKVKGRGRLR